jgi:hypothetical protein
VANILRGPGRERYDYFLSNGFPKWKGTEYYYSRYRPGFGTVVVGVFLFAGGAAHYIALYMGWKRQREFVERYIKYARNAAWGENLGINIPGVDGQPVAAPAPAPAREQQMYEDENGRAVPINRKMRRLQEKDARKEADKERAAQGGRRGRKGAAQATSKPGSGAATPRTQEGAGPTGSKKRVVAENGKVLVVDSLGDVYLEQEDEEGRVQEFLLDVSIWLSPVCEKLMLTCHQPNEIARPTISDTAVVRLPIWLYQLTVGRVLSKRAKDDSSDEEFDDEQPVEDEEDDSEPGKRTPSTDSAEDFELLDKSVESLGKDTAKASGASQKQGKAGKRKNKKR